jgi:hypothetical protein
MSKSFDKTTTGFVILNVNNVVWGREAFATADIAEAELRHFFKRDLKRSKFTGDYAGMVADAINRKYPAPKPQATAA